MVRDRTAVETGEGGGGSGVVETGVGEGRVHCRKLRNKLHPLTLSSMAQVIRDLAFLNAYS